MHEFLKKKENVKLNQLDIISKVFALKMHFTGVQGNLPRGLATALSFLLFLPQFNLMLKRKKVGKIEGEFRKFLA